MNLDKVNKLLGDVKTELVNMSLAERKIIGDVKSDMKATVSAARALNVLGRMNSAVESCEEKFKNAVKKLEPRAKKAKKDKKADSK